MYSLNSSVSSQNSRIFTNRYVINEIMACLNPEATHDNNLDPVITGREIVVKCLGKLKQMKIPGVVFGEI